MIEFQCSYGSWYYGICSCICVEICIYLYIERDVYLYKGESNKENKKGAQSRWGHSAYLGWVWYMRDLSLLLGSISPPVPVEASQASDVLSIIGRQLDHFFLWLLLLWISLIASLVLQVTGIFRSSVCLVIKTKAKVLCRTPTWTTWEVHWESWELVFKYKKKSWALILIVNVGRWKRSGDSSDHVFAVWSTIIFQNLYFSK